MVPEMQSTETTQEMTPVNKNENRDSFISAVQESDSDDSSYLSAVEFQTSRNSNEYCVEKNIIRTKIELTYSKIPLTLFSIIMYLTDVGSDWTLGIRFAVDGQWLFFMLTFMFILISSLLITYLSRQKMQKLRIKLSVTLMCLFNLTPVPIYWHIICVVRRYLDTNSEKIRRIEYKMFLEETCNVNGVKLIEGYFEATPQFILQNTILFSQYPFKWSITMGFQLFSILTSSIGFILTIFSWYRSSEFRNNRFVSVFGGILYAYGMAVPLAFLENFDNDCINVDRYTIRDSKVADYMVDF